MVKTGISVIAGVVLLLSTSVAQERTLTVRVTNPSMVARVSETISIRVDSLKTILSPDKPAPLIVREAGTQDELRSQLVDDNQDGTPDELIFQSDFKPGENKTFMITSPAGQKPPSASMTDARYVEPREDLAWENDRIAFRVYGPALAAEVNNGIDVWTKRVRYLIVKKWYEGEEQIPKIIYHVDHGEGADFFDVGNSLGCGGTGVWFQSKVYQPGVFSSYKVISAGPIRACFELYYDKWNVDGRKFREIKTITLDAGQNLNHVEVRFMSVDSAQPTTLACGLVKRPNTRWYKNDEHHWMSLWGLTTDSLVNGYLGTGVVFPGNRFTGWTEDSLQYIALLRTNGKSVLSYYAGAGWTRSGDFKSEEDWNGYLDRFSVNLQTPLQLAIVHGR